jgi:hypothetical protein
LLADPGAVEASAEILQEVYTQLFLPGYMGVYSNNGKFRRLIRKRFEID